MKQDTRQFAEALTVSAVSYREELYELRAGDLSHWYVDCRKGLSGGLQMARAADFIVNLADQLCYRWDIVAGSGVAGRGLAAAVAIKTDKPMILANDNERDSDPENGYGLHGADPEGNTILEVDDIGSTGSSLIVLANMLRGAGGVVEQAINVCDRSGEKTRAALAAVGIKYSYLLEFDEKNGMLVPAELA